MNNIYQGPIIKLIGKAIISATLFGVAAGLWRL